MAQNGNHLSQKGIIPNSPIPDLCFSNNKKTTDHLLK